MRKNLIAARKRLHISPETAAKRCQISELLYRGIEEDGWITHPHIASRICHELELSVKDYNAIVHASHRARVLPKPVAPPTDRDWHDMILRHAGKA